jgi:hypothetical protein
VTLSAERIDELCVAEAARVLAERGIGVDLVLFGRRARAVRQRDRGVVVELLREGP